MECEVSLIRDCAGKFRLFVLYEVKAPHATTRSQYNCSGQVLTDPLVRTANLQTVLKRWSKPVMTHICKGHRALLSPYSSKADTSF